MTGNTIIIAEINRQSSPNPNKLVTRIPNVTINWKENPRAPFKLGMAISPNRLAVEVNNDNQQLKFYDFQFTDITWCDNRTNTTSQSTQYAPNKQHT